MRCPFSQDVLISQGCYSQVSLYRQSAYKSQFLRRNTQMNAVPMSITNACRWHCHIIRLEHLDRFISLTAEYPSRWSENYSLLNIKGTFVCVLNYEKFKQIYLLEFCLNIVSYFAQHMRAYLFKLLATYFRILFWVHLLPSHEGAT
jgi:hypothetical protein